MKVRASLLFVLFSTVFACSAQEHCEGGKGIKTNFGLLTPTECVDQNGQSTRQWISLNDNKLLEDKYLSDDFAIDKTRAHWVFAGPSLWETGCPSRLYLIDISTKPVTVIAFGVKSACNEFHWASWGKKRSVIALKDNVKFTYQDGKITPPKAGPELYEYIKPNSMHMTPVEQFVPFAEDVSLPKGP